MKEVININEDNIYSFMDRIKYGSNLVMYKNDETRKIMLSNLDIITEILGAGSVAEKEYIYTDVENGEYVDYEYEGVFNILYSVNSVFPKLTYYDYKVNDFLNRAKIEKSKVRIALDERLRKYAFKIARSAGIKFGNDVIGYYFDAQEKQKPIFKQLEDAYISGLESISFDASKSHTVRCYASTYGNAQGQKFRCSIVQGRITVYFREMDNSDKLFSKLNALYNEFVPMLGKKVFKDVLDRLNIEKEWPSEVSGKMIMGKMIDENKIPDTDDDFYDELSERDYEAEARNFVTYSENAENYKKELKLKISETVKQAISQNDAIRNVEGLQQYCIAELEEKPTVNTDTLNYTGDDHIIDEDDDF